MDRTEAVHVERVSGHVRAGPLVGHGGPPADDLPEIALAEREDRTDADPSPALALEPRAVAEVLRREALAVGALVALFLATRDAALAIIGGGVLFTAQALRAVAGSVRFGFGDGFLGFRSDATWPRGVQEDDDFQWSWPSDTTAEPSSRERWAHGRRLRGAFRPPTPTH